MSRRRRNYLVWGAWLTAFAALELPAAFKKVPWDTLSTTAWGVQEELGFTTIFIQGGLSILQAHIVRTTNILAGDGK